MESDIASTSTSAMFQFKICGITTPTDAAAACAAGADAIGINFYPESRRYVDPERAAAVAAAVSHPVKRVGVFVNADVDAMLALHRRCELDAVQLHGDESPDVVAALRGVAVIVARRVTTATVDDVVEFTARCREVGASPAALLIDAHVPGHYGGTGAVGDWEAAGRLAARGDIPPLILAGGLTPDNVADAIRAVRPAGVDVAGGVEAAPGTKDADKMRAFVDAAKRAFSEIDGREDEAKRRRD